MNQRLVVSVSAVALVAVVAGGAALAVRSGSSSHTPRTITVQGGWSSASEAKVAADTASGMMAPNQNVTYVISGNLPALDGSRPAWQLAANPTADLGQVAALAKAFGLDGDVKTVEGGWQVGDPNAGASLFVNKAPGLPWYFSDYAGVKEAYACGGAVGLAPDADPNTTVVPLPPTTCPEPAPPTGVPTKDEALAKTSDLLKAIGVDAGALTITANASEWSADVQAVASLDGIATPALTTSFGFGGEGKLTYASGFLLAPEKADSYPLIGTTKAFELLKSGKGFFGGYGFRDIAMGSSSGSGVADAAATTAAMSDSTASNITSVPAIASDLCVMGTAPSDAPTCPPVPCAVATPASATEGDKGIATSYACAPAPCTDVVTFPETTIPGTDVVTPQPMPVCLPPETVPQEPVTITITGVHETLLSLMGSDGSMWLVPGYEFTTTDGGTWPVLAIDQSFVDQVAPTPPVPETAVAVGTAPVPAPETALPGSTIAGG